MPVFNTLYLEPSPMVRAPQAEALRASGAAVTELDDVASLPAELQRLRPDLLLVGSTVSPAALQKACDGCNSLPPLVCLAGPQADYHLLAGLRPAAILAQSAGWPATVGAVQAILQGISGRPAPVGESPVGIRDNALNALWESEKRYRGIVENAAEGIWSLDCGRVTTYVNTRMAELLGFQPSEVVGHRASEFIFLEDRQRAREKFTTCLAGEPVRFDFRLRRRDQGELFVTIAASPVFNQAGQVTGVVGLLTDVTTRELIESQLQTLLQEQEAERVFLQTLLDNLPVAVAVLDARDFHYRFLNAAMRRSFFHGPKPVGKQPEDVHPQLGQGLLESCRQVIASGEPLRLREFEPVTEPGEERTFWDADYLPVCDESGKVTAIILITREVTASVRNRRREEEMRAEAEERARDAERGREALEQEVARRLSLEDQLRRSNQDLLQFAYVISHDLQEPMRNVASFSRLLVQRYKSSFDALGEEFLGHIMASADRMRQMIDDLLVYSRVAHDSSSHFDTVPMNRVVAEAMANLERSITENQATIICNDLPEVSGEFGRLAQLFQNLIGNAIKYRSAEPPLVKISARLEDRKWLFSISDNGVGIEPRYAEQIFGVFRRLHGREYPGTGIGLAIARQIVERHGGRIWVESDGANGSTFHFTLQPCRGS